MRKFHCNEIPCIRQQKIANKIQFMNLNMQSIALFHPELSRKECAKNLGIGDSTLYRWKQEAKANNNQATFKGSGNLTEAELENRRLKRELKDTQDALEILKKSHQHSGRITQVLYCLVSEVVLRQEKGLIK